MVESDNNAFQFNPSDNHIACVGENGGTSDDDILMGFRENVNIIYKEIENDQTALIDTLVYPLCYSVRHSVELAMKIALRDIQEIYHIRKEKYSATINLDSAFDALKIHDLALIICSIKSLYQVDSRIETIFDDWLSSLSCYDFDNEGIAFKYSEDLSGNKVLIGKNISSISIDKLVFLFREQMKCFDSLICELEIVVSEYKTGTFTRELSRKDIHSIAEKLPDYSEWKAPDFIHKKNELMCEFKIGSRQLTEAINIIKTHPKFANEIGLSIKVGFLSKSEIEAIASLYKWDKDNSPEEAIRTVDILEKYDSIYIPKRDELLKSVSREGLATVAAFMEIEAYSEDFDRLYQFYIRDSKEELIRKTAHYSCWRRLKRGMLICGQVDDVNCFRKEIE